MSNQKTLMGELVIQYMRKQHGQPVTSPQLAKQFGVSVNAINRTMGWLEKQGKVIITYEKREIHTDDGILSRPIMGTYKYTLRE